MEAVLASSCMISELPLTKFACPSTKDPKMNENLSQGFYQDKNSLTACTDGCRWEIHIDFTDSTWVHEGAKLNGSDWLSYNQDKT